jgi:hypothetical protein
MTAFTVFPPARLWAPAAWTYVLLAGPAAQASTLLVDGFDAPSAPVTSVFTSVNEELFNQFSPSVLGGVRGVYHHTYTNPLGSVSALAVGNGVISSSSGVGTQTEVLLMYGAFTRPTLDPVVGGPLLGLDSTPYDTFRLNFSGYSSVLNLNVVLYTANPLDPSAPLYYSTVGINAVPAVPGGPMVVDLGFNPSNPDFNFAQVDGIAVVINRANGATNVSWTLDSFSLVSAVPEPTPAALLLAGIAVLGWLRRRQLAPERQR